MPATLTHKDLQAAAKNINAVFNVKPQIKTITSRPNLERAITDALADFVASEDDRISLLEEGTIQTYNALVGENPLAEVANEMAERQETLETIPAAEAECPVFGKEYDPSAPECMECGQADECAPLTQEAAAAAKAKADSKTKKATDKASKKAGREKRVRNPLRAETIVNSIPRGSTATLDEIAEKAHALYVSKTGRPATLGSTRSWMEGYAIPVLRLAGVLVEEDGGKIGLP
jgi:hypothetical protein